jgi:hypothetical protein
MPSHPIKAGAVAFTLGAFAIMGPAQALSPFSPAGAKALVIEVVDEETAVEEALEPDVMLPGSQEGGEGEQPAEAGGGGGDGSAGEIPALEEAFPSTYWPPSDREKKE